MLALHFVIAYFLGKHSKFGIEISHTLAGLLKNDQIVSNLLFMKQNLANSISLRSKNGGLKAWSHSVRKANFYTVAISTLRKVE